MELNELRRLADLPSDDMQLDEGALAGLAQIKKELMVYIASMKKVKTMKGADPYKVAADLKSFNTMLDILKDTNSWKHAQKK